MKFIIALIALSFQAKAVVISPEMANNINEYHRTNAREIELYKTMNELGIFQTLVMLECNNGEYADWRISQYHKPYMRCVNDNYRYILSKISPDTEVKPRPNDLLGENNYLGELLKELALNNEGLEYVTNQHGYRHLDLKDQKVTVKKIRNASYQLAKYAQE